MGFDGQYATGEILLKLEQSKVFQEFRGQIRAEVREAPIRPEVNAVERRNFRPTRVVAVDGSIVTTPLNNGFPMAEASLVTVSIVSIDLQKLQDLEDTIPHPGVFFEMEKANTHEGVLPGANVIHRDRPGDTPSKYVREEVHRLFNARLDPSHETLLETVRALSANRTAQRLPKCPIEGCDRDLLFGQGPYPCNCPNQEELFETDAFRFIERFSEVSSNGEAHGSVRHVLEVVSFVNFLRFFAARTERLHYLRDNVFVLDGPLAVFGTPAWLAPLIRTELTRINDICQASGFNLAVFGFEKSGAFVDHFERLDFCPERGPRSYYPSGSAITPDARYINRYIALRPDDSKPHGQDTYFGRKVMYKTASGEHAVITTGMVTEAAQDFHRTDAECFPRLGDMLDVLDHLATYLFKDGFMPLVRAHAHAAIPLTRGADIIRSLFAEQNGG
jgi:hypothetical protein